MRFNSRLETLGYPFTPELIDLFHKARASQRSCPKHDFSSSRSGKSPGILNAVLVDFILGVKEVKKSRTRCGRAP